MQSRRSRTDAAKQLDDATLRIKTIKLTKSVETAAAALARIGPFLKHTRIPSSDTPSDSDIDTLNVVLASLYTLDACVDARLLCTSGPLTKTAEYLLTDIWKWCHFILSQFLEGGPYKDLLPPGAPVTVATTLTGVTEDSHMRTVLLQSTPALERVADHWLASAETASEREHAVLAYILDSLLERDGEDVDLSPVLRAAGGSYQRIARTVVRWLRLHLGRPSTKSDITSFLSLLECLANSGDPSMLKHLLFAGGIPQVVGSLRKLCSLGDDGILGCLFSCHLFMHCVCTDAESGGRWVQQAIENGYLQSIVESSKYRDSLVDDSGGYLLDDMLGEELMPRLIDRGVVKAAAKQLRRHPPTVEIHPRLTERWSTFYDLLHERQRAMEEFEEEYCRQCHACKRKVDSFAGPPRLMKCGGCAQRRYCSTACQSQDWPAHKRSCRLQQDWKESDNDTAGELLQGRDEAFVQFVARQEVRNRWAAFAEILADKYPDTPVCDVCLEVDFYCYPPELDVQDLAAGVGEDMANAWQGRDDRQGMVNVVTILEWGSGAIEVLQEMQIPDRVARIDVLD